MQAVAYQNFGWKQRLLGKRNQTQIDGADETDGLEH